MATEESILQKISEIDSVETLREIFAAVAIAIRNKGVDKNPIHPGEFAELIESIETGIDTSDGTAIANDIAKDKIAYSKDGRIVGILREYKNSEKFSFIVSSGNIFYNGDNYFHGVYKLTTDHISRIGSILECSLPTNDFGEAKVNDVLNGVSFTSRNGLKLIGTYVPPEAGVNTSDATATENDIASGKIAYGSEGKIIGAIRTINSGTEYANGDYNTSEAYFSNPRIIIRTNTDLDVLYRNGSMNSVGILPKEFGDATASDVASGKTFTSIAGLRQVGTKPDSYVDKTSINLSSDASEISHTFPNPVNDYSRILFVNVSVSKHPTNNNLYIRFVELAKSSPSDVMRISSIGVVNSSGLSVPRLPSDLGMFLTVANLYPKVCNITSNGYYFYGNYQIYAWS